MTFRDRLRSGELLAATWVKTPHMHVIEVLALSPLDLLVLDAEHAPFGRQELDACILAARAGGKPVLVRPASAAHEQLLQALDSGASGVIVPHIRSAAEARDLVRACHYGPGGRGFAGSTRAAAYSTLGMVRHHAAARDIAVVAQIEDAEAIDEIEAIAMVEGIDALFIGRADLTISLGETNSDAPQVIAAVERICTAGRAAGRAIGMFLARPGDVPQWREKGASLFVLQSDQEFLLTGASALVKTIKGSTA